MFRCQACLAEEVGKPLVIHLVKAVDELLKVKRDLRPSNPWIIHMDLAAALLRLSMGDEMEDLIDERMPVRSLDDLDDYGNRGGRNGGRGGRSYKNGGRGGNDMVCLLYTSRCV